MIHLNHTQAIQQTPPVHFNEKVLHSIKSDVILGSPSARCNGVGICRVMGIHSNEETPCPKVIAEISHSVSGHIWFTFEKEQFSAEQYRLHFSWGVFQVAEDYRMPLRIGRALGWKNAWIRAGVYEVIEFGAQIKVCFNQKYTAQA